MMEQEHIAEKIRKSYPYVGLVFGTHVIHLLPQLLWQALSSRKRVFLRGYGEEGQDIVEGLPVERDRDVRGMADHHGRLQQFLFLLHRTACARARAQPYPQAVEEEFRELLRLGYKEIVLLGQNVNSYGKTLDPPLGFPELLRRLDRMEGDYRLRFMTSHPKDATHELLDVMAQGRHICHSLHLPFQAGSDRVLREMNRGYTRRQYLDLIAYAKRQMPDMTFTSDVIVGFPGETYEEFQETLAVVRGGGICLPVYVFVFPAGRHPLLPGCPIPCPSRKKAGGSRSCCVYRRKFPSAWARPWSVRCSGCWWKNTAKSAGFSSGKPKGIFPVILRGDLSHIGAFVPGAYHAVL